MFHLPGSTAISPSRPIQSARARSGEKSVGHFPLLEISPKFFPSRFCDTQTSPFYCHVTRSSNGARLGPRPPRRTGKYPGGVGEMFEWKGRRPRLIKISRKGGNVRLLPASKQATTIGGYSMLRLRWWRRWIISCGCVEERRLMVSWRICLHHWLSRWASEVMIHWPVSGASFW